MSCQYDDDDHIVLFDIYSFIGVCFPFGNIKILMYVSFCVSIVDSVSDNII